MPPVTPYSKYLGDRNPIAALRETSARIGGLTAKWSSADFERTYQPGKWSARLILAHLAHIEMVCGTRVRMALSTPGYVVQPFDQDRWMEHETGIDGRAAADAFLALARINADLFSTLSPAEAATPVTHPEAGPISVDWIIHMLAGHQVSHLQHFEEIAGQST
jgi:hypothetical protein